eukprot:TRINITY_DN3483_c0_g1_i1.p2 TRINITY_DN3483_c0_g1~~TRINITY_DN3483_c0_g1_i1.p2  ORF type:complete len:724 (-),score=352.85 TRINITY_DN3483_c0_g1_i1:299-2413(-)
MFRLWTATRQLPANVQDAVMARSFHSSARLLNKPLFDKILVANRGEIAIRVMKTAKRLGIKTVAVHSDVDSQAEHVKFADEAVCIGPAPTAQSYLNIDKIIDAMRTTGAQAVHPGYGFLSENAKFADAVKAAGKVFIGPTGDAMRAMGDKIESKKLAKKANVNVIPGRLTDAADTDEVLAIANEIGYPVMIKASAGGGGKGMRIAWNAEEARDGFVRAKQEALASFGDDRCLIEKYIDEPRHIEIQVMGDQHGNVIYLNERECSIQRRNQKVLEEAPSPFLDEATRRAMGEQAVSLARAVGYSSAGTVEFLVDPQRNFYFLEMNTRLQVEHPVTEYTTGLDLVEIMLRSAAGQQLPLQQSQVPLKGWAMEARVYAEDPYRNFLPSIGRLTRYRLPDDESGLVRVDGGVTEGSEISIYYDPLISKLIAYGANREESRKRLARALDQYEIRGVQHNIPLLRAVLDLPDYASGAISTKFLPKHYPDGFQGVGLSSESRQQLSAASAVVHWLHGQRDRSLPGQLPAAQAAAHHGQPLDVVVGIRGTNASVNVQQRSADEFVVTQSDGKQVRVSTSWRPGFTRFEATIDGEQITLQVQPQPLPLGYRLVHHGTLFDVTVLSPRVSELAALMPEKTSTVSEKEVLSPMPGKISSIAVKPGQKVTAGQELLVVEAMKMQNVLRAPSDAVVKSVLVKPNDNVLVDAQLIVFE